MAKSSKAKKEAGTRKRVVISDTKAYDITAIEMKGVEYIGIRQMYATKKDTTYKPSRNGLTFSKDELESSIKVLKRAVKMLESDETVFEEIEPRSKGEDDD